MVKFEWKAIFLGQFISMLIAGTGIFAALLSGTTPTSNFPALMSLFNYIFLSSYLFRKWCFNKSSSIKKIGKEERSLIKHSNLLYWYICAAVIDVEANFLVLMSFNYTNITSVMLLDCFAIPCAMLLSYIFLGCRYTQKHYFGTVLCLTGLLCIILNDSINGGSSDARSPVLGDILCLCGSALFACSNVLQESIVKFHNREEFLGHLGGFATFIALVQCMIIELPAIKRADFSFKMIFYIIGYVICLFLMYINTSSLLQISDSILFNLSLLTSDVYAVLFTYFYYNYVVNWLYFLSFGLVIVGLVIYHSEKKPIEVRNDASVSLLSRCEATSDFEIFPMNDSVNENDYDNT
jgi:solute carrier family 35 protein F1/2